MKSILEKSNRFSGNNKKLSDGLFILLIFLYLFIFVFQGLDFADQGVYATIYQQIFHAPESIQYMFSYWLTAIIGGLWLKLFPDLGLFGIRIAGILTVTATISLVYYTLKEHLNIRNLRIGLFLAVIVMTCRTPFELNYDNLSVLFWTIGSLLLYHGLKKENLSLIFLSGVVVGLNVFIRIPNILGFLIVVSVFYYGWLTGENLRNQFKDAIVFIAGFLTSICSIILIMILIGHFKIFMESIYTTIDMGVSQEDNHNLAAMVYTIFMQYYMTISYACVFIMLCLLYVAISGIIFPQRRIDFYNKLFLYIIVMASIALAVSGKIAWKNLEFFVIGICIFANILNLVRTRTSTLLKLLSFLGLLMLLVFPMGSAGGLDTAGRSALWFALPIGIEVIKELRSLNTSFLLSENQQEQFTVNEKQIILFTKLFIYPCILAGLIFAFSSPYFDRSSRLKMVYPIKHHYLRGIYTTGPRAAAIQELLAATSDYVKPDDYVLAYGDIPMYYYLTETKPYLRNPWPGLYTSGMLRNAISHSLKEINHLPLVVLQKVKTINTNWPENDAIPYFEIKEYEKRNHYIRKFLDEFDYRIIWENRAFIVMKPGIENVQDTINTYKR